MRHWLEAMDELEDDDEDGIDDAAKVGEPKKLNPVHWVKWKEQFELCLSGVRASIPGATLDCVIRDESKRPERDRIQAMTPNGRMHWMLGHTTAKCRTKDGPAVCALLKELLLEGDANTHLRSHEGNGVTAWTALRQHHDGMDQRILRIATAQAHIEEMRKLTLFGKECKPTEPDEPEKDGKSHDQLEVAIHTSEMKDPMFRSHFWPHSFHQNSRQLSLFTSA